MSVTYHLAVDIGARREGISSVIVEGIRKGHFRRGYTGLKITQRRKMAICAGIFPGSSLMYWKG